MAKTPCVLIEAVVCKDQYIEVVANSAEDLKDDFWAVAIQRCKKKRKADKTPCREGECEGALYSCVDQPAADPLPSFPDTPNDNGKFKLTWTGQLNCSCQCEQTKTA